MESTTLSRKRSYIETAAIFPSCVYKRDTSHIVPRSTLQKSFWQDNLVHKAKIVINKLAECWLLVHGKQTCVESHSYVPKKLEFFLFRLKSWNVANLLSWYEMKRSCSKEKCFSAKFNQCTQYSCHSGHRYGKFFNALKIMFCYCIG